MAQTTIQKFQEFGKRYGFRVTKYGSSYQLSAKNTDDQWCDWINFHPDKNLVTYRGNTDHLNIWLYEARKDFTPEKCLQFVQDLNEVFELPDDNRFLVRDLIDPEDWQEIARVQDAYKDTRYLTGKLQSLNEQISSHENAPFAESTSGAPPEPCR